MDNINDEKHSFESLPLPQGALDPSQVETPPEVRRVWNKEEQMWYYSVIDFVKILTSAPNPTTYWARLRSAMKKTRIFKRSSNTSR